MGEVQELDVGRIWFIVRVVTGSSPEECVVSYGIRQDLTCRSCQFGVVNKEGSEIEFDGGQDREACVTWGSGAVLGHIVYSDLIHLRSATDSGILRSANISDVKNFGDMAS